MVAEHISRRGEAGSRKPAAKFEDLIVWQKAHQFVLSVYRATSKFPADEKFGLTSQFRRAAISIPANIAEGFKRRGKGEKIRFLNISQGSAEECRYYLILARDLQFTVPQEMSYNLAEVIKLLESYALAIQASRF